MVYKFFDKKSSGNGARSEIIPKQQLAEELHKPIIRKIENGKYAHVLKTIFMVLILRICNYKVNVIKKFDFYDALLVV